MNRKKNKRHDLCLYVCICPCDRVNKQRANCCDNKATVYNPSPLPFALLALFNVICKRERNMCGRRSGFAGMDTIENTETKITSSTVHERHWRSNRSGFAPVFRNRVIENTLVVYSPSILDVTFVWYTYVYLQQKFIDWKSAFKNYTHLYNNIESKKIRIKFTLWWMEIKNCYWIRKKGTWINSLHWKLFSKLCSICVIAEYTLSSLYYFSHGILDFVEKEK